MGKPESWGIAWLSRRLFDSVTGFNKENSNQTKHGCILLYAKDLGDRGNLGKEWIFHPRQMVKQKLTEIFHTNVMNYK